MGLLVIGGLLWKDSDDDEDDVLGGARKRGRV